MGAEAGVVGKHEHERAEEAAVAVQPRQHCHEGELAVAAAVATQCSHQLHNCHPAWHASLDSAFIFAA